MYLLHLQFGHTPDFYRSNQGEFSHRAILTEYGAEELAEEMLTDKGKTYVGIRRIYFCEMLYYFVSKCFICIFNLPSACRSFLTFVYLHIHLSISSSNDQTLPILKCVIMRKPFWHKPFVTYHSSR